jgi:opacity protein-like surface antigen
MALILNSLKNIESTTAYTTATASVTSLITTYRDAVKDSTEAGVLTIFYKAADKKEAITDAAVIQENITKFGANVVNTEFTELGLNKNNQVSKRATGFGISFIAGFDHRMGDAMLGIEVEADIGIGGKIKVRDKKAAKGSDGITAQRQWGIALKPRIGYMVAPQFEVYLTVGAGFSKYKVDTKALMTVLDHAAVLKTMAEKYNATEAGKKDSIDLKIFDQGSDKVLKTHSKTKFTPIVGAGLRYQITPDVDFLLEYNYLFKAKLVDTQKAGAEVRFEGHKIKAGAACRVN